MVNAFDVKIFQTVSNYPGLRLTANIVYTLAFFDFDRILKFIFQNFQHKKRRLLAAY